MYLFLRSDDSKDVYPLNSPTDFTVDLPEPVDVTGFIALCEIDYRPSQKNKDIYVFCDWCHGSCVDAKILPLLRVVDKPEAFSKVYYLPVRLQRSRQIRIYMREYKKDIGLVDLSFDVQRVRCTLRLKYGSLHS
jgi:hypothetical protein